METKTISLTINGETREIEVRVCEHGIIGTYYAVSGIEMQTTTGKQRHHGTAHIRKPGDRAEFTEHDLTDLCYHGMRGNGHARTSRLRYVGWAS